MAYGSSIRAPLIDTIVDEPTETGSIRSAARSWQRLSHACRLALVERGLRSADDLADGFPAAL